MFIWQKSISFMCFDYCSLGEERVISPVKLDIIYMDLNVLFFNAPVL